MQQFGWQLEWRRMGERGVRYGLMLACLIVAGCHFGAITKRQSECHCPTDIRKTVPLSVGEDAQFQCPCGPSVQDYGYKPTSWREWPTCMQWPGGIQVYQEPPMVPMVPMAAPVGNQPEVLWESWTPPVQSFVPASPKSTSTTWQAPSNESMRLRDDAMSSDRAVEIPKTGLTRLPRP